MNDTVLFFVIVILILILLVWYLYSSDDRYNFCGYDKFASIVDQSDYFGQLNATDLKKRHSTSNDSYKLAYKRSFCQFSISEQARLIRLTKVALNIMPAGLVGNIKWSYAKIGDDIELGLPHTLGDNNGILVCICSIPFRVLNDHDLLEIICHEIAHVYQRTFGDKFVGLVRLLGFVPYNINGTYDHFYNNYIKAANPDTWNYYAYDGCVLLSVYFGDDLENTDAIYNLSTGKTILHGIDFGCGLTQQDHPFEIVAASLAKIAIGKGSDIKKHWRNILTSYIY